MIKKYAFFLFFLFPIFVCAQNPYYYTQGDKVYLSENQFVKYIKVNDSISEGQALEIQQSMGLFCWRVDEFSPFFNKYYIDEHQFTDFLRVFDNYRSFVDWQASNYAFEDTDTFYPTGLIFAKILQGTDLQIVFKQLEVPYDSIRQDKYTPLLFRIYVQPDQAVRVSALLYETGLFVYSTPDFMGSCELSGYNDNPNFQYQWAVNHPDVNMNLLSAWSVTTGHPSVKIAIVDVGVDLYHPDLVDNLLEGYDAVNDNDFPSTVCCGEYETEEDWHGTCCAGIIGAANNNIGVVGVAHTSKIIPIRFGHRVLYSSKDFNPHDHTISSWVLRTSSAWAVDAMNHACYEDSADVISCSFRIDYNDMIRDKLTEICSQGRDGKGCVVVFGSGNSYDSIPDYLNCQMTSVAKHPHVISVGSITPCGKRVLKGNYCNIKSSYSSCYGDSLDVVAPGIMIPTTNVGSNEYINNFAGTSSATPHVAGVAALILSVNPCLTREEVKYIIESTCTKVRQDVYSYGNNPDHPNGTWNIEVGHGLVNAGAAVALAQQIGGYTYVNDTVILSSVLWNTDKMINQDLYIDSLATLTITDTLYVGKGARIIVRPGGKLIVDGGTLTSACAGEMWQGIEVVGNRTQHQNAAHQGTVILRNNATIENAHCAVKTGLDGNEWLTSGGIVQCTGTTFKNNRRAVSFYSYADTLSSGNIADNKSWFKDCTFTLNDTNLFLSQGLEFLNHVTLWDVKGVAFEGCTFKNLTTGNIPDRKHAIYALGAGIKIRTLCDRSLDGCNCHGTTDTNVFRGFSTAVEVGNDGCPYTVTIDEAKFENNGTGVFISACDYATVTRCAFDLSTSPIYPRGTIGLALGTSTGYKVEGNTFTASANATSPSRTGIRVFKSGYRNNSIYRNTLNNLDYGIFVSDTNGSQRSGLCFTCNTFNDCDYGIYVDEESIVALTQGNSSKGADNRFTGTQSSSFHNEGPHIKYHRYYSSAYALAYPYEVTDNNDVQDTNLCSSTICGNVGPVWPVTGFGELVSSLLTPAGNSTATAQNAPSLEEVSQTYYAAVRRIMADSVESLPDLLAWHTAAGALASPYALTEIFAAMDNSTGVSHTPQSQADVFSVGASHTPPISQPEMDNYADFRALADALRPSANNPAVNWPAATPAQIGELQRIAEANTGRSSAMARGVLCFFFDICYEEDWDDVDGMGETRRGMSLQNSTSDDLLVWPNPTDATVTVETSGDALIKKIMVYDSFGRMVLVKEINDNLCTLDLHHLDGGLYFIQAIKADGDRSTAKVIKN